MGCYRPHELCSSFASERDFLYKTTTFPWSTTVKPGVTCREQKTPLSQCFLWQSCSRQLCGNVRILECLVTTLMCTQNCVVITNKCYRLQCGEEEWPKAHYHSVCFPAQQCGEHPPQSLPVVVISSSQSFTSLTKGTKHGVLSRKASQVLQGYLWSPFPLFLFLKWALALEGGTM